MMSKAKWFVVRNPSTGEIVATSANQIVPLKFHRGTKLYYIQQTPLSSGGLKVWVQDLHASMQLHTAMDTSLMM